MKWKETHLKDIYNVDIIYFDESKKEICARVCKVLYIDSLPDISSYSYWKIIDGIWKKESIEYELDEDVEAFSTQILDLMTQNTSHIVYTTQNHRIGGLVHFTDYECPVVYSNIYQNLNTFERKLRDYLIFMGLNDRRFLEYLEAFKLPNEAPHYQDILYKRISKLKKRRDKKTFDNIYLSELLEFATSEYVTEGLRLPIKLSFLKEEINGQRVSRIINDLRNFIMHHDNITGEVIFNPQYFSEFERFFNMVLTFKDAFSELSKEIFDLETKNKSTFNKSRLDLISRLNDKQLTNYFYNLG